MKIKAPRHLRAIAAVVLIATLLIALPCTAFADATLGSMHIEIAYGGRDKHNTYTMQTNAVAMNVYANGDLITLVCTARDDWRFSTGTLIYLEGEQRAFEQRSATLSYDRRTITIELLERDFSDGWTKEGDCWFYYYNGVRVTGWQQLWRDNAWSWFHFTDQGVLQVGFQYLSKDGGAAKWYCFDEQTGALRTSGTVSCMCSDGKNHKFAVNKDGSMGKLVD